MSSRISTSIIICLLLLVAHNALAEGRWEVVVQGESNKDTLPLDHLAYTYAEDAIADALQHSGFDVFEKAAIGIDKLCSDDCQNVSAARVIQAVRNSDRQVDLLVRFTLATADKSATKAVKRIQVLLHGEMTDLETGRLVAVWDKATVVDQFPSKCSERCVSSTLAGAVDGLADTLGVVLAEKLTDYQRVIDYEFIVDGLAGKEFRNFRQKLRALPGFQRGSLKDLGNTNRNREWLHQRVSGTFTYDSTSVTGKVDARVADIIEELGIDALVNRKGRRFYVARDTTPYLSRYIGAVVGLFLLMLICFLLVKHQRRQLFVKGLRKKFSGEDEQASQAYGGGRPYHALSIIDKELHSIDGIKELSAERTQLEQKRLMVMGQLQALSGRLVLGLGEYQLTIFISNQINVGRPSRSAPDNAITIGYDRISRPAKQCKLLRQGNQLVLEDQGSSNGTVLGGQWLGGGQRIVVPVEGAVLAMGGHLNSKDVGLCQLMIRHLRSTPGTWLIEPSVSMHGLLDKTGLINNWLSLESDLYNKWLSMADGCAVVLGLDETGKLCLDNPSLKVEIARLVYESGYYLEPCNSDVYASIDGAKVCGRVPITAAAIIEIAGQPLKLLEGENNVSKLG